MFLSKQKQSCQYINNVIYNICRLLRRDIDLSTLSILGGRGPNNEKFCISVWPETQFQIFQNLFHRQITSCTALFNYIWHTLKKIIVCMHCSFKKWLKAIYIYPHPAKITPNIYQYGQSSWRCSILQNPSDSFKNISNTQCKLWHFQKWPIKCL
jgi:hypothetical protein